MDWGLTIGSWQVYFFGLLTALSALFSLVAADRGLRRRGLRDGTGALFAALAVFLGFLFSRLLYCLCVIDYLEGSGDYLEIFRLTNGGYTLFGALLGVCLAGLITGKISGQKSGRILDCAAVSLAVFVAAVRVIASFVEQGRGMDLEYFFAPGEEDPAYRFSLLKLEDYSFFQRFPFAVEADGSWYWAVFVLETLAALCIALYLYRRKDLKDGGRITLFMMLYAACQIPLEAMKRGAVLRLPYLSFVRANQVFCAAALLILFIAFVIRLPAGERKGVLFRGILLLAGGALLITAMEFSAFEKKITQIAWMPADVCHLLEAVGSMMMFLGVWGAFRRLYLIKQ